MIDWAMMGRASDFYTNRGYEQTEVPWWVDRKVSQMTCPSDDLLYSLPDGDLIGSGEQGFLSMVGSSPLLGKRFTVTPCFRREPQLDRYHQTHFMKLELFSMDVDHGTHMYEMIDDALELFHQLGLTTTVIMTNDGFDIMSQGVELGSYGVRSHSGINWAYGTGLALPRTTGVMSDAVE